MALQKLMVERIDEFCGCKEFISRLEALSKIYDPSDRFYIDSIMICFNSIYEIEVYVVGHTIDNKKFNKGLTTFLNKHLKKHDCKTSIFVIELVEFKIDYVKTIRKLTGWISFL